MSDVFEAVADDLEARNAIGWAQNRKPLLANEPGRDWLREAYEEALDMAVYLKAELLRREQFGRADYPALSARWRPWTAVLASIALATVVLAGVGGVLWLGL